LFSAGLKTFIPKLIAIYKKIIIGNAINWNKIIKINEQKIKTKRYQFSFHLIFLNFIAKRGSSETSKNEKIIVKAIRKYELCSIVERK
jgi:hypothetical protein